MGGIWGQIAIYLLVCWAPSYAVAEVRRSIHPLLAECRSHFAEFAREANIPLDPGRDTRKVLQAAVKTGADTFEGQSYQHFLKMAAKEAKAFHALISFGSMKKYFVKLGAALRGEAMPKSERADWVQVANDLDRLFVKAPKFSGLVFRGEVREEGSRISKADAVEKAFLSTSVSPVIALGHSDPDSQVRDHAEERNREDHHYEADSPYYDMDMADIRASVIRDVYGDKPVRLFTVFDFSNRPTRALWMPAAYKAYNPEHLENRFSATGNVWREDEIVFPRNLKFRTTGINSVVGEDGVRYIFRVREPTFRN